VTASASKASVEIGKPVSFSGTAATVEAGDAIASYQWSFDDGATVPAGASAAHAFATPGAHSATLTVKDLAGLSASAVVSVSAMSLPVCASAACAACGGTAGETAPCLTGRAVGSLRIKPSTFHAAGRGGVTAARGGAAVSYTVLGGVSLVSFTVKRVLPGLKSASGACVPHRHGMHGRSCTRYSTAASFSRVSRAGGNGFRLTGRANGKKLTPGGYVLSAHVASDPRRSITAVFRVVR
jgi:PKD repeat protein